MTAPVQSNAEQIEYLLGKFGRDASELKVNNAYYNGTYRPKAVGLAVPPAMKHLLAQIGWSRTYLGSLEERLDIEGFILAGKSKADDRLWQWWQANRMDVESGLAHTEALVHGRAYVTIAAPNPNDPLMDPTTPVIKVESPRSMYAEVDPVSGRVTRAIRVYNVPVGVTTVKVRKITLYLPNSTIGYVESNRVGNNNGWIEEWRVDHNLGIVPVVPILNKERIEQQDGCSEIKPELRSVSDAASRLMMNMQATAELMAIPQRVIFGVDRAEIMGQTGESSWEAYIANLLAFEDPDGKISQFAAAELRNFGEGMEMLRKEASGYTGLPPQYFSFSSDNPASADAIRASEDRLVKKAERKCRMFGEAWEMVMRIALKVMDGTIPTDAFRMETVWRNPATPTFAAMADAVVKLATAITPDGRAVIPVEMARIKLNFSIGEREEMEKMDKNSPRGRLAELYGPPVTGRTQLPEGRDE
jgi:hypothetical protein